MSRKSKFVVGRVLAVVTLGVVSAIGFTGATTTANAGNTVWCC